MIEPTLCIYHGNCADGFGAAWAVWKKFPDIRFHPGIYGEVPPDVIGEDVVLVDFSYSNAQLNAMLEWAKSITVLDHHKTAEEALAPLLKSEAIYGIFDMERSGAMITWDWFHPGEEAPQLLKHIQDRDLWKFELAGTEDIQAALFSYPYEFDLWNELMNTGVGLLECDGVAITRKHKKDVAELIEVTKRQMIIGGHWIWVVNLPYTMASDACHSMCKMPIYPIGSQELNDCLTPFAASYFDKADGTRVFSLRSVGEFDVGAIAKQYGGGGHKNSAGFSMPNGWEGGTK